MIELALLNIFRGEVYLGIRGEHIEILEDETNDLYTAYCLSVGFIFISLSLTIHFEKSE